MENWQKCPKCNAEGKIFLNLTQSYHECHVCDGGKLINSLTGHPRKKIIEEKENIDKSLLINILKNDTLKNNDFDKTKSYYEK